ncbi:MAG TPA: PRC-barrel domain-containing protein [Candidatus Dormibacteraeota bacterium]|nr:PRC-barrel domain-containing protein [Candidatus Dormibacteraeota bacterium]
MSLRRTKDLKDFTIAATDADIGLVHDLYFDDQTWTIRYIVVETGGFLSDHKVLISPLSLRQPALRSLHIWVNLTWRQVDSSPSFDLHKPVSRQHEIEYHDHYGWPYYWEGTGIWGSSSHPHLLAQEPRVKKPKTRKKKDSRDVHLRSAREVTGYHVLARDGEIGHVEDFLFDDESWQIRYAIVDTRNWWPGKRVLLRPQWIKRMNWADRKMQVNMSRETIKNSPPWNPNQPVSRTYELRLHKYYESPPYWTLEK